MHAYIHIRVRGQSARITQTSQKLILASSPSEKKEYYSNTPRANLRRGQSTCAVNRRCTTYVQVQCITATDRIQFSARRSDLGQKQQQYNINTAQKIRIYMVYGVYECKRSRSHSSNLCNTLLYQYTTNYNPIIPIS